jgi:transketolase
MRVDFVKALSEKLAQDETGMVISGDLGFMAFEQLAEQLGKRFVNAGVAEQNMVGVAAGAALSGLTPWVYSIAPFATYRCLEQIRNDVCLHDLPVRMVGNGGGYTYGIMGSTHHALEDLGALKPLPNLQLFFPCENNHVAAAVRTIAALRGPAYLRLAISGFAAEHPVLSEHPVTLTRHYAAKAANSTGVTVVGAGHGVQIVLSALNRLGLASLNVDVFGIARFPFDLAADASLRQSLAQTRRLVFVEEHYAAGGMGESFVATCGPLEAFRHLSARYKPNQRYGSPRFHLQQCNLTPEAVVDAVRDLLPS